MSFAECLYAFKMKKLSNFADGRARNRTFLENSRQEQGEILSLPEGGTYITKFWTTVENVKFNGFKFLEKIYFR